MRPFVSLLRWAMTVLMIPSLTVSGYGQVDVRTRISDELTRLAESDTNYINKLYKYGETFELENNDSAFSYYERAHRLSLKYKFINGQLRYYDYTSILLVYLGRYDEGAEKIEAALKISTAHKRKRFEAIEYNQYGTIWQYKAEMHKAAEYYMRAYETAEKIDDKELMNVVAGNLSGVFLEIGRFDKAREFSQINLDLANETQDTLALGYGLINLSSCNIEEQRFAEGKSQALAAIRIAHQFSDEALELFALNNFGSILTKTGKIDSAILVYEKSYSLAEKQDITYHLMFATQGLGDCFYLKNDLRHAIGSYNDAMILARKSGNLRKTAELNLSLSQAHEKNGDLKLAIDYRKQYDQLRDSIQEVEQSRNINELETRYRSEKQQRELTEKNLEIEQEKNKSNTRLSWMAGLTFLLIGAVVVIMQRIKISRAREQSFQKELQYNVLKAGENERTRIAKDLHDDVGSTLSSIHVYSKAAQMHWAKKPEEVPVLIQRISLNSENMMDRMSDIIWSMNVNKDSGEKLVMRIKTFAQEVLGSREIETFFDLDTLEEINLTIESRKNLLLIFKESINNMSKYSNATLAQLQCIIEGDHMKISIKDNGCGFLLNVVKSGNGLTNMQHRAQMMNGIMTIHSAHGAGTEIAFDLPIAKISDVSHVPF